MADVINRRKYSAFKTRSATSTDMPEVPRDVPMWPLKTGCLLKVEFEFRYELKDIQ
jgi:hypothetical protein